MSTSLSTRHALHLAAGAAVLAPSVHNTQPWRFVIGPDTLEVVADRFRRLAVSDSTGRQMYISVGCAVLNARASLAAAGMAVSIDRFPNGAHADLVARLRVRGDGAVLESELAALEPLIELRQTNRRQFSDDSVPAEVLERLQAIAALEDATLRIVDTDAERETVAALSQAADTMQITDPRYRAELREWTTNDPNRLDGVRAAVVPHVDGSAQDDMPIRDFDTHGAGWLPADTRANKHQCLAILGTESEGPLPWVRAGEALERIWLEITRAGFVASLFTQIIEVPGLRVQLRDELKLTMQPHIVLRIGRAPATAASLRRHLADMVEERAGS